MKYLYISGIGRSGSTLLDLIISSNPKTFSVGEVYKFYTFHKKTKCACGKNIKDCDFWENVSKKKVKIVNHMNLKDYQKIIFNLLNPFTGKIEFENTSNNKDLIKLIKDHNKNVELIVDSSKEIGRLIELHNDYDESFYNIIIIRDPRATAYSFSTKTQSKGKNYYVALFKWMIMNTLLYLYIRKYKPNTLLISYKNLCENPNKEIDRIERLINIEIPKDYVKKIQNLKNYHNFGGNRIARKENREHFQGIRYDNRWKKNLFRIQKIVGVPFQIIYNLIKTC